MSRNKPTGLLNGYPHLVHAEFSWGPSNKPGKSLRLTLRFGELRYTFRRLFRSDAIYVALRSIFLNINPTRCKIPDEDWTFNPRIASHREIKRTISSSGSATASKNQRKSASAKVSGTVIPQGQSLEIGGQLRSESSETRGSAETITDEFSRSIAHIISSGNSQNARWKIVSPADDSHLHGTLFENTRFCRVVGEVGGSLQISLEIPEDSLVIGGGGDAFSSANKRIVSNRRAIKEFAGIHVICENLRVADSEPDDE